MKLARPLVRPLLPAILFAVAVAALPSARAESFTEPSTGHAFEVTRTENGKPFVLLGAGVRKRFIFKVYAMGLYVDEEGARRAFPALAAKAGGRTRERLLAEDRTESFVVWGDFEKIGVLHFMREVDGAKVREAFEETLEPLLSDKAPPELRDRTKAFIALFDRDMQKGEEIVIRTLPDGRVQVEIAGTKKDAATDARLARGIWDVWLGSKPISTDLKKALVERIETLGR